MSNYIPIEGENLKFSKKCRIILLTVSTFISVLCIGMLTGGSRLIIDNVLQNALEIKRGSKAYFIWKDTPIPLYMRVYIFNLTNPTEFLNGELPVVKEVGPFTFSEFHHKTNITTHPNNTITYMQRRKWIWNEELSDGHSLNEKFTIVNVLPVTAAYAVRDNSLLLTGMNTFFRIIGEKSIISKSAGEILFDGYKDPLLNFINQLNNGSAPYTPNFDIPNVKFPKGFDRFGWFYTRNNSPTFDGIYNMYTGEDSLDNVGKIDLWNHHNVTNFFDGEECNEIKGSAGEIWPPGMDKSMIEFFNSDLCSTLRLFYANETTDTNGITGYKFTGVEKSFERNDKDCFCVEKHCTPKGTLNAESCRMGAPAAVSFPHFLHADPSLVKKVHGLNPNPDNHTFFMSFIPELGVPMEVMARVQINIQVNPVPQISVLNNVPDVLLPMIWFEVSASLDTAMSTQLKPVIFVLGTPLLTILYSLFLFLSLLVIVITVFCVPISDMLVRLTDSRCSDN